LEKESEGEKGHGGGEKLKCVRGRDAHRRDEPPCFFSRGLIRGHEGSLRECLVEILEDDRAFVDSLAFLSK
jgi:hypothetical protein